MGDRDAGPEPGVSAKEFREILENTTGISVAKNYRKAIYKLLSETMNNVMSHAYEERDNEPIPYIENAWWVSGDYNINSEILSVYVYDQGIGIPKSFRTKKMWIDVFDDFKRAFKDHHDGDILDSATASTKTRTGLNHRGKGLRDMRRWITGNDHGELRIMSGSGDLKVSSNGEKKVTSLQQELGGTLIHWRIKI